MTEGLNKNLVPPSKKTVNFLYTGLVLFYPENVHKLLEDLGFKYVLHSERDLYWSFAIVGIL